MGHIKLFIQKYTDNSYFHFTMLHDKYDTIYSSYLKIIQSIESNDVIDGFENKYKDLIDGFENKYKDFTIEIFDTSML